MPGAILQLTLLFIVSLMTCVSSFPRLWPEHLPKVSHSQLMRSRQGQDNHRTRDLSQSDEIFTAIPDTWYWSIHTSKPEVTSPSQRLERHQGRRKRGSSQQALANQNIDRENNESQFLVTEKLLRNLSGTTKHWNAETRTSGFSQKPERHNKYLASMKEMSGVSNYEDVGSEATGRRRIRRHTTARPKWEHQVQQTQQAHQVLHVIIPTESTRLKPMSTSTTERIVHSYNPVQSKPQRSTPYSSQNSKIAAGTKNMDTDLNRRLSAIDDVDCDQVIVGSQAQRRSASQNSDSRRQHTAYSVGNNPCRTRPTELSTVTHHSGSSFNANSTLLANVTISRPAHADKALDGDIFPKAFVPEKSSSCSNAATIAFCDAPDYPTQYIEHLLTNTAHQFNGLFGKDEMQDPALKHRIDIDEMSSMCPSMENVIFPKKLPNKEDKLLFIINQPEHQQGVRVEVCAAEGPCQLQESLPFGIKTSCKQKYIYRKMVALTERGETMSDSFKLPSCCSCQFKQDHASRMAFPKNMSPAKTRKP